MQERNKKRRNTLNSLSHHLRLDNIAQLREHLFKVFVAFLVDASLRRSAMVAAVARAAFSILVVQVAQHVQAFHHLAKRSKDLVIGGREEGVRRVSG